jgi:hypothetical protein
VIGVGTYAVYLLVRRFMYTDRGRRRALRNGRRLLELEERLGIAIERPLQQLALRRRWVVGLINSLYVSLNVLFTIGSLLALYRRRDSEFHRLRRAASLGVLACQPVFIAFPASPPRKLEGFVDTINDVSGLDIERGIVCQLFNPVAAIPSIHIHFAVVTAAAAAELAPGELARRVVWVYPGIVTLFILVTANHYFVDALAGGAVAGTAIRAMRALDGRS